MDTKNVSVIIPAHLSHTGSAYRREISVDEPVAEIVRRLNHPVFGDEPITVASCAHGLPTISMADGSSLVALRRPWHLQAAALALGFDDPIGAPRFELHRDEDPTGVSGTGVVADGWALEDRYVVRWRGEHPTTTFHSGYESVEAIHLHRGLTRLVWVDRDPIEIGPVTLVFSRRASSCGRPGWLLSLTPNTPELRAIADRCPGAMRPDRFCADIDPGGPESRRPRHGDHLFALGDFEVAGLPASSLRRHLAKPMRVSRLVRDSEPAVISLAPLA